MIGCPKCGAALGLVVLESEAAWLSPKEAARELGCDVRTVRRMRKRGDLTGGSLANGRPIYLRSSVLAAKKP